jgi:RNA polymerase sigma-54 factor
MALESRLELRLSQKLILTPQLQQAIKMLQMPQLELSQFLTQEMMENPLLEESLDELTGEDLSAEEKEALEGNGVPEDAEAPLEQLLNYTVDEYFEERGLDGRDLGYFNPGTVTPPSFEQFLSREPDLYDHLLWQLRMSHESEEVKTVAEMIIGNIDENGYLEATLQEIAKDADTRNEIAAQALCLVQSFDPAGVGARNPRECLLLQVRALGLEGNIAEQILEYNLEDLEKKRYSSIAQHYNLPLDEIIAAVKIIEGLEPKPGRNFSHFNSHYVVPDVFLIKTSDGYQIVLNDEGMPRLRVNSYYRKLIQQNNAFPKEDKQYLIEKLRSAMGLLKSLDQRNRTIYRVTETLINLQRNFFDHGVEHLKPLTLREVASSLNLHESTVSRVTSNKYLACTHGIFGFRFLFSSALSRGMGSISSTSVKNIIRQIITEEDANKPLSDQSISEKLRQSSISIARRTVAKYREELGIPSQIRRKKMTR